MVVSASAPLSISPMTARPGQADDSATVQRGAARTALAAVLSTMKRSCSAGSAASSGTYAAPAFDHPKERHHRLDGTMRHDADALVRPSM